MLCKNNSFVLLYLPIKLKHFIIVVIILLLNASLINSVLLTNVITKRIPVIIERLLQARKVDLNATISSANKLFQISMLCYKNKT